MIHEVSSLTIIFISTSISLSIFTILYSLAAIFLPNINLKFLKMKKTILFTISFLFFLSKVNAQNTTKCAELEASNKQLEADIKMYTNTWDHIFNNGGDIEYINDKFFDKEVKIRSQKTEEIYSTGIEGFKKHYNNYLLGFTDIKFTIIAVFGQGKNLVKHWNFKAVSRKSGKSVNLSGVTLVVMKDGKVYEEQDFDDNLWWKQQLGQIPMD